MYEISFSANIYLLYCPQHFSHAFPKLILSIILFLPILPFYYIRRQVNQLRLILKGYITKSYVSFRNLVVVREKNFTTSTFIFTSRFPF
jgi:hypothetical protein